MDATHRLGQDATHYFAQGVLCGARSSRLAIHRGSVTCPACLERLAARGRPGPETARVLERYAALCLEEETCTSGEWAVLSLRGRRHRHLVPEWMRRLLGHR